VEEETTLFPQINWAKKSLGRGRPEKRWIKILTVTEGTVLFYQRERKRVPQVTPVGARLKGIGRGGWGKE